MKRFLKGKGLVHGSSSSQRHVDEAISNNPKSTSRIARWPEEHNVVLAELLYEQFVHGNICNGNLRKEQWPNLVNVLNRRLGTYYTASSVMIRFKNMKADFRTLYQLTNRSGWGWDEELHIPIATEELWEEIVQVTPKLSRYRRHPFHQYEIFEKICADNIAVGNAARSNKTNSPTVNLDQDETPQFEDDFLTANGVTFEFEETPTSNMPEATDGLTPNSEPIDSQTIGSKRYSDGAAKELLPAIVEEVENTDDETHVPRRMFDRSYTGHQYVLDVLSGHPGRAYQCFRLPPDAFISLRDLLVSRGHLSDTKNMLAAEQLGIFLRGVAHAHSYRQLCEFFQHSLETVSRYFNQVLKAIVSLSDEFISIPSADVDCHPFIRANEQFHPFFKNAVGAIDGTHIPAVVSTQLQNRYRNRKGFTSQNVMAAVSFDRQFVYVASGWEGSAADMRVLRWAVEQGQFEVPRNKYFLVDSGYANTDRLIAPFRGYRYHLADYRGRTTRRYVAEQELFNHRHAQLRNVVERTFGIWKERFQVLTHMRQFPISVQADIVIACAVLHNFIGRYHGHDLYFNMSQTEMQHVAETVEVDMPEDDPNLHTTIGERIQGEAIRHNITIDLWNARIASQRNRSS
ncbi:hypothetical protein KFK09_020711 [Dendrobium nobile]|uniref:Transposase n=1 Tax=Dendrobium nobile TaxID=94219 RepID=A0A8T3ANZ5_DENNO|nr:hypothetical protein KFK09_020711 [Dendrobium nobile]